MSDVQPPVIKGLTFTRLLGAGGQADVYLYTQELPSRQVAVKVLKAAVSSPEIRDQFVNEANVMAQLEHPYIVPVYAAGLTDENRPYLVMQHYPRASLADRIKKGPFRVREVLRIGVHIGGALATAHQAGILHCDIKPHNILISQYGSPGLSDFGISSRISDEGPALSVSVPWAPPEAFDDHGRLSVASDVYSLAATLWHLLVGHAPFSDPDGGPSRWTIMERILSEVAPPTGRHDVPASLEALLARGLAKKADDRPATMKDLVSSLQAIERELGYPETEAMMPLQAIGEEELTRAATKAHLTMARPPATPEYQPTRVLSEPIDAQVPSVGGTEPRPVPPPATAVLSHDSERSQPRPSGPVSQPSAPPMPQVPIGWRGGGFPAPHAASVQQYPSPPRPQPTPHSPVSQSSAPLVAQFNRPASQPPVLQQTQPPYQSQQQTSGRGKAPMIAGISAAVLVLVVIVAVVMSNLGGRSNRLPEGVATQLTMTEHISGLAAGGNTLVAIHRDGGKATIFNTNTGEKDGIIKVGSVPSAVVVDSGNKSAYVLNSGSKNISVIDLETDSVKRTIYVSEGGSMMTIDRIRQRIYVTGTAGVISVVNLQKGSVEGTLKLNVTGVTDLAVNSSTGTLFVSTSRPSNIVVVDTTTMTASQTLERPAGDVQINKMAVDPNRNKVYLVSERVQILDAATLKTSQGIDPGVSSPTMIHSDSSAKLLYVGGGTDRGGKISIIDTGAVQVKRTIDVNFTPRHVDVDIQSGTAWIAGDTGVIYGITRGER